MKEKQLSLLDLQGRHGVLVRHDFVWSKFFQDRAGDKLAKFKDAYSEEPILWKRFNSLRIDVYMTEPRNSIVVSLSSGKLLSRRDYWAKIYETPPDKFSLERRKHLSKQTVMLLDQEIEPLDWKPELMERIRFKKEEEEAVQRLLKEEGVEYSLEKEVFKNVVRVFAAPYELSNLYKKGLEKGLFE